MPEDKIPEKTLLRLWEMSDGKAWEPGNPANAILVRLIAAGYLRRMDGRFLFERMKDSHVGWTEAGRAVCERLAGEYGVVTD